jgi:DNA-binding MarR family transcriptional regulator
MLADRDSRLENRAGAWALAIVDATAPSAHDAALTTLLFHSGVWVGRLANATRLTHSGAVRLLDRLEREGLVERRPGPDARTAAVHLTPRGRTAARRVLRERDEAIARLLAPLSDADRAELGRLLDLLLGALPASRPNLETICRLCDYVTCDGTSRECPVDRSLLARGL